MADSPKADEKKPAKQEDDPFETPGRPTAQEVAEKAARDQRVEKAPDFGGKK